MAPRRSLEKLSRRAGVELGLKGARHVAGKAALARRPTPPGQHGKRRTRRESDYMQQLKEKQKLQWFYGVPAGQLRRYHIAASRRQEATGEELLALLELRLDNVVYRMGFAGTRAQARQFVSHGHITVNGVRVNRPGYQVSAGDVVAVKPGAAIEALVRDAISLGFKIPTWLAVDPEHLMGRVTHRPDRSEIDVPADESRAVEFFAKF